MESTRKRIPISEIDPRQALHELQLYHEELEFQNKQLEQIRQHHELLIQKYTTLYDQSPSGYITLDRTGKILELNSIALLTLGQSLNEILYHQFIDFIAEESKSKFENCFQKIFENKHKVSCEAILSLEPAVYIHFEGISTDDGQSCFLTMVDITMLKRTEEALNLRKKEFQSYFENGSVGMTVSSPGKGWIEINQKFCQMIGYTKEELIGINWIDLSHPDDLPENLIYFNQALDGKIDKYQMDKRFIRKDGQVLYVTLAVVCQRNNDGSLRQLLSSYIDITDHKHMGIALRKSEEKYRKLLEFAPDAFFHGDPKGNLIMTNDKAVEFTGYSKSELLTMNISDLFPEEILVEKPLRYDLLAKGDSLTMEREIKRKDGKRIYVEMISKVMPDGTYQCLMKDISTRKSAEKALKESEERFKSIFEDSPDAIVIADLKSGIIIDVNHASEKLFFYKTNELVGLHHSILFANEREEKAKISFGEWGEKPGRELNPPVERTAIRSDGKKIPVEIISKVINLNEKQVIYGTFRDISKRKNAESELRESEKRYRLIAENSGDVIWILDLNTMHFRYISPSIFGLRGYTVEEVMEQEISETLIPESYEMVIKTLSERIEKYRQGYDETYTDEFLQPCKNGKIIWTETVTKFIKGEGDNHIEILGVTRDITQRKIVKDLLHESEERFKEIFESSPDASIITDIETGLILKANDAACKLLKKNLKEIIGTSLSPTHSYKIEEEPNSLIQDNASEKRQIEKSSNELVVIRSDGKEIPVSTISILLTLNGKKVLHNIFRDIHQEKSKMKIKQQFHLPYR